MQIAMSEAYIKEQIDELIKAISEEYSSGHELTTKVANYYYYSGKLSMLYSISGDAMEFITYRKDEIDELTRLFNRRWIQTLYNRSRRAEARINAYKNYGAREVFL